MTNENRMMKNTARTKFGMGDADGRETDRDVVHMRF